MYHCSHFLHSTLRAQARCPFHRLVLTSPESLDKQARINQPEPVSYRPRRGTVSSRSSAGRRSPRRRVKSCRNPGWTCTDLKPQNLRPWPAQPVASMNHATSTSSTSNRSSPRQSTKVLRPMDRGTRCTSNDVEPLCLILWFSTILIPDTVIFHFDRFHLFCWHLLI